MLSNPYSIALLIGSFLLILFAVLNKNLRKKHNKEVKEIKDQFEKLTKKEQSSLKRIDNWAVVILEVSFWSLIIFGGFYLGTK